VKIAEIILLFVLAFLPPIIYAIWIRNTENFNREKWRSIALCFIWGGTIAIIAAFILEVILSVSLAVSIEDTDNFVLLIAILIAPFAEELTKPLALKLKLVNKELNELEDGLIYGAITGLGFSATENLIYGISFFSEGLIFFIILMILRSIGGCLLHASATALTGFGYGKFILRKVTFLRVLPYFALAIFVHAFYNFLLTFEFMGKIISLFAALLFAIIVIQIVRYKIRLLDSKSA
jgi:RsiW-degrading membrane proteinase PrsW (M82 family)